MFGRLVPIYDRMNRLLSGGLDTRWRRAAVRGLEASFPVLDVGAGTGDLSLAVLRGGNPGPVVLMDLSIEMLRAAEAKLIARGLAGRAAAVVADGEHLPFRDGSVSAVVSAFVLRNLEDPPAFFRETARALTPRGRAVFLEISQPPGRLLRWAFRLYFFRLMPAATRLMTRQARAYDYLAASVQAFPPQAEVRRSLEDAGFAGATVQNLAGGMAAIYRGVRR
jgi:demethylmenaquinone methyltransferase/2-methoxy-6-polyprenyl-1,4-benzoquinol methylase